MKNKLFLFTILTALVFALVACGGNDTDNADDAETDNEEITETAYEAEDVSENDVCEVCAMAVPDNQHATQIVLTNDRSLKFDDIGCMHGWIDENGEDEIGTAFVRDFNTEEWFDFEEATFVYDEEIETPMAYGVISFADEAKAEEFVEEYGKGDLLNRADLSKHEWKMNKEMMDHGHDHDEHDHDEMDEDHES